MDNNRKVWTHTDGDTDAWADEYTCHADESNFVHIIAKECAAFPMVMNPMAFNNPKQSGATKKCELLIGLSGGENYSLAAHMVSMKVRPTMTNQTTFNAHNQTLADASTAPASYTNQTLSGSICTSTMDIYINCTSCSCIYINIWVIPTWINFNSCSTTTFLIN